MKSKEKIVVNVEQKVRKVNPPRTAFKPGNEFRFKPGEVHNTTGRPKDELRLVSKAMRAQLNTRAPDAISKAAGATRGASWAQCIAASLIRNAARGDISAANVVIQATEGSRSRLEVIEENAETAPKVLEVVFVESDGNGRPRRYPTVEAMLDAQRQIEAPDTQNQEEASQ